MKDMEKLKHLTEWLRSSGLIRESAEVSRMYKSAISEASIGELKNWLDGTTDSKLSFNDLFEESLRLVVPFNTKEQRALIKIISLLRDEGWMPAGRGGYFDTKKVNQKMRHLGGEEYDQEIEVADLKVVKETVKTIPAGPRAGEEIVQRKVLSLAKALGSKVSEGQLEWWLKTQTEYVKDYNWKQLEAIFHKQAAAEGSSIIISRDPIDVLRMSDHRGIDSCHSEGNSYFECAVAESRGNGLVAYLVDNGDLNKLLQPESPWGSDQDVADMIPGPVTLDSFDGKEIFKDPQRSVSGIEPKSRVRLRKYVYEEGEYEFAAPEHRTYGPHPPGFVGAVREWAWNTQRDLWPQKHGELTESARHNEEGSGMPEEHRLQMHGGSYRDTTDGEILNSFFAEGEFVTSYSGNVGTVSDNEEDTFAMWENEIEEVITRANAELKHVSFQAEVGGEDEQNPYVWASVSLYLELPFAEGEFAIPKGEKYGHDREFAKFFEHPEYGHIDELSIDDVDDEDKKITLSMTFNCDDCNNPDDVSNYFDYVLRDIDGNFNTYVEKVRRRLVKEGYIAGIEFDRLDKRLSTNSFENFNVYGSDIDEDGEILISTKPEAFPPLKVDDEFTERTTTATKEGIMLLLQAEPHPSTWHKYILNDSYNSMLIGRLNKVSEATNRQLHFDFGDGWTPPGGYDPNQLRDGLELSARIARVEMTPSAFNITLGLSLTLKVSDSEESLLHAERFLQNLDKEFTHIAPEILKAVEENMDKAVQAKRAQKKEFRDGMVSKPIIDELKGLRQPSVIRLALWVEKNWDNFNDAEKEIAHYSFLLPAQRDGDYIHKDELDAPRFWDGMMQARQDTGYNYRWKGLSMKDVMPYTDPNAEPGKDPNYGSGGKWIDELGGISPPTVAELERIFVK
jgi:hypothetical protein